MGVRRCLISARETVSDADEQLRRLLRRLSPQRASRTPPSHRSKVEACASPVPLFGLEVIQKNAQSINVRSAKRRTLVSTISTSTFSTPTAPKLSPPIRLPKPLPPSLLLPPPPLPARPSPTQLDPSLIFSISHNHSLGNKISHSHQRKVKSTVHPLAVRTASPSCRLSSLSLFSCIRILICSIALPAVLTLRTGHDKPSRTAGLSVGRVRSSLSVLRRILTALRRIGRIRWRVSTALRWIGNVRRRVGSVGGRVRWV